jgi:hypothetical protein
MDAPPLGAPLWLEAMPERSGELSAGFLVALGTFRNQHTPCHQASLCQRRDWHSPSLLHRLRFQSREPPETKPLPLQ